MEKEHQENTRQEGGRAARRQSQAPKSDRNGKRTGNAMAGALPGSAGTHQENRKVSLWEEAPSKLTAGWFRGHDTRVSTIANIDDRETSGRQRV